MGTKKEILENNPVDTKTVNEVITGKIKNFSLSKKTLENIATWCLNGEDEEKIKANLELTNKEWIILINACPEIIEIMQDSYLVADIVVAGTLYQTAIGGRKIKKQVPLKIKDYDDNGKVIRERYEIYTLEEELPPNGFLLKFLAENKMSDNFSSKNHNDRAKDYSKYITSMTDEEKQAIMLAKKGEVSENNH